MRMPRRIPRAELRHRAWGAALAAGATVLVVGFVPPVGGGAVAKQPPTSIDMTVPMDRQQESNDCEAAALRMVLAFRGIQRSDKQLLSSIGVDLQHPHFGYSGKTSGDPYKAFVGNPNGSETGGTGYGVFYPPVADAARANGAKVLVAQENYTPAQLYLSVRSGHPALVWIDYLWRALKSTHYTAYDGRSIPYAGPAEHVIVLVGVTPTGVYVNDPARGYYWIAKTTFEKGYSTYRDMAVVIR